MIGNSAITFRKLKKEGDGGGGLAHNLALGMRAGPAGGAILIIICNAQGVMQAHRTRDGRDQVVGRPAFSWISIHSEIWLRPRSFAWNKAASALSMSSSMLVASSGYMAIP